MNTPSLWTRDLAAVSAPLGLDVVSATVQTILRPSTPPEALTCLKRASMAAGVSANVDAAAPVRSLMIPILIVVGVIPGALDVESEVLAPAGATVTTALSTDTTNTVAQSAIPTRIILRTSPPVHSAAKMYLGQAVNSPCILEGHEALLFRRYLGEVLIDHST